MRSREDTNATVTTAAVAFERRWTLSSLRRVDAHLEAALQWQITAYYEACREGTDHDVAEHGAALVRGYSAAAEAMLQAGEAFDAYLIGSHKGLTVLISDRKAVAETAKQFGSKAVWISPDEVAALLLAVKAVAEIKGRFPGAEIIDRYAEGMEVEPSPEDERDD
jgi:hypothetical protein